MLIRKEHPEGFHTLRQTDGEDVGAVPGRASALGKNAHSQYPWKDMIRKAFTNDIGDIHRLLNHYAAEGLLLPRALSELYDHLRDFYVLEDDHHRGAIIGACALGICWEDLAEIRSLAVSKDQQGNRFGAELVTACLEEARTLGVKRIFTLTYIPDFFSKMGFREVEKSELPHKVWADCLKCTKFPDCDETAMILELEKEGRCTA